MISTAPRLPRGDGNGIVWPDSGTGTDSAIRDPFGPRPFSPHIATTGFDYDFHRGIDVVAASGDPVYASQPGTVQRWHYTHFGWEADSQLEQWTEVDPNTSVTFARVAPSTLRVTGDRVGAQTFPAQAGRYDTVRERVQIATDDWELRLKFASAPSTTGQFGFGLLEPVSGELLTLEYDGTTFTVRAVEGVGAMGVDGTTQVSAAQTWARVRLDTAGPTLYWERSTDGAAWSVIASSSMGSFSGGNQPIFIPVLYWRSTDVNATPDIVDIESFGWYDDQTIPRFGNWAVIETGDVRVMCMHMRELLVAQGDIVHTAGLQIGTAGKTGFDALSGPILADHIHLERIDDDSYFYDNDLPINPLSPGFLPRVNVDSNVAVVRTTANDPDGVASWKLAITVTRADQDFDLNLVTLVANLATRTINFDTRAGLNADNDIPKNAGVYIVPQTFDESSPSWIIDVYFNKSVVGATFTSYSLEDTAGTVVASG